MDSNRGTPSDNPFHEGIPGIQTTPKPPINHWLITAEGKEITTTNNNFPRQPWSRFPQTNMWIVFCLLPSRERVDIQSGEKGKSLTQKCRLLFVSFHKPAISCSFFRPYLRKKVKVRTCSKKSQSSWKNWRNFPTSSDRSDYFFAEIRWKFTKNHTIIPNHLSSHTPGVPPLPLRIRWLFVAVSWGVGWFVVLGFPDFEILLKVMKPNRLNMVKQFSDDMD